MTNCVICTHEATPDSQETIIHWSCPRCGKFKFRNFTDEGLDLKAEISGLSFPQKASLSRVVRKGQPRSNEYYTISESTVKGLTSVAPHKQAENLIYYLGDSQETAGNYYQPLINKERKLDLFASIGLPILEEEKNFQFVCESLGKKGLLESSKKDNNGNCAFIANESSKIRLSLDGWHKYEELSIQQAESMCGFMAMKFPKKGETEELERVYDALKDEIRANTKFVLDNPCLEREKAGSITNRIAVEIRRSRFIVADLTHKNDGAYWEAGFAHGLGKPVFYICKEGVETHFDTNQHTTIRWVPGEEKKVAERLRYAIVNTLPEGDKG